MTLEKLEQTKFDKLMSDLEAASSATGVMYHQEAIEKAMDILNMINQWAEAYPPEVFGVMTKEDWQQHHAILRGQIKGSRSARSGSAAAADCMRYVVTRMKEQIEKMA